MTQKIAIWVNTVNDIRSMQRTLLKLVAWVNRWDMDFNVNKWNMDLNVIKCGVMQIRKKNLEFRWMMGGSNKLM